MSSFVHLRVHSAYSLAEGAIPVKDLVKRVKLNNMGAVAVTDTNNMFGALEFALAAHKEGVQPIIGAQVTMEDSCQVVLLCKSPQGYLNLSKLVSDTYMDGAGGKDFSASYDLLAACNADLICLSGGPQKGVIDPTRLSLLKNIFGDRFYIELQRHDFPEEDINEAGLIDFAYTNDIPLVATNDCYFLDPSMHEAHDALLCIADGRYISEADRRRVTKHHFFKSAEDMEKKFSDVPEAIANTAVIAERCAFLLKSIAPILPPFESPSGLSEIEELRKQSKEGLQWRLDNYVQGRDHSPYWERLDFELNVIEGMGFPGYFLICSDFIKWAKDHGIPVGPGRGSGAGSIVAWSLRITDLDPLEFNLLFERFLNPERVSMPDFDVDFCQDRRDEVISYVQKKYGHQMVAQIITFGKLQARNTVRDVGRVLQMPYGQVDRLAKMIPNNPANPISLAEALEQDADLRAERDKDETSIKLIDIALKLEGLYRHASTHAAGVVIADRPLYQLCPVYRDPRSDMPVTQFNMKYVESAGLVKFDFLGLKTLTVIQKSLEFIRQTTGREYDILKIPMDDAATYELLSKGDATGVFQLESAGMKDVLRKMKPNRIEDIIALVSLYRPGPMDNIPHYIAVKQGRAEPDYLHPKLKPILEETFGIMVYQEQVMQAAQVLAGYTLGGADLLRRAMGKKIKEEMDKERGKFVEGAAKTSNVPAAQAEAIFEQIAKFAGYGFNKSHAAAYALIAYQTAWLKANYPVEFMAASMTLDYGNTEKLAVFKQECDRMGIEIVPPDINQSGALFHVKQDQIHYALAALKGVGEGAMHKLIEEREKNGQYQSLEDFIGRLDTKTMNRRQFEMLVASGAFDGLHKNRAQLHGGAEMLLRHAQAQAAEREAGQVSLFGDADGGPSDLPPLPNVMDWDPLERLSYEFGAVGFYLSAHPLDGRREQLARMNILPVAEVPDALRTRNSTRVELAGILLKKQERMAKSGNKFAFLQLSDSSGVYEVMIFSETLARSRGFLEPGTALLVTADADVNDDQLRLTGQAVKPLDQAVAHKLTEVHVHMDAPAPAAKLKELIGIEGTGAVKISLFAHLPDGTQAEIIVPGRHAMSPAAIHAVHRTPGIIKVEER
jgi:DNA polymerase-3 subunit alpha